MAKMSLKEAFGLILDNTAHSLKMHEDEGFARRVFRAEITLESAGVSQEMLNLLAEREIVGRTDCDTLTHGPNASREISRRVNAEMRNIDSKLSDLANSSRLSTRVRKALDIPD